MPKFPPPAPPPRYIAFHGGKRIAEGTEAEIGLLRGSAATVLVFDAETSEQIELPAPAAAAQFVTSHAALPDGASAVTQTVRPGRPKLGVIPREVTLLPHDWDWLNAQPGGASVTLRKLVLKARRANEGTDRLRHAQVVCYRFIHAIAGNEIGFEEATRALFAGRADHFTECTETWPTDVRAHARLLAQAAFAATASVSKSMNSGTVAARIFVRGRCATA